MPLSQSETQNVIVKRGDTVCFEVEVTDETGTAIDITGWIFFLTMKDNIDDADGAAVISVDVATHTDPTNGKTLIEAAAADTDALTGDKYYDIQYKDLSGKIRTLMSGIASFDKDVTRRTS